jgi:type I restriction enzyme S subunit
MATSDRNIGTTLARGFSSLSSLHWPLVRASALFELKYGKSLVETTRRSGLVPVFGTNGQCGWHDRSLRRGPGVVLGRKGQGPLGVEWVDGDYWVIDTAYSLALLSDDLDLKYCYYLIKYVGLNHLKDGTSNPSLSRDTFGAQLFPLAPPQEQRAIAHVLSSLDEKIDLLYRANQTLEETARAIFKSWFVDYDPVRAKAAKRRPSGLDAKTAKSFPSTFENSKVGDVPTGWQATSLGEAVARCGGAIQTGPFGSQLHASDYVPEGVPVVMPKDIVARRVSTASIARIREQDAERLSRHRMQLGDLVYSRRGDVERHALTSSREVGWLCGTGCLLVRLGPKWPSPIFASFALDRPETRAWVSQHAIGATMPNLNTGILGAIPLLMPPDDVLRAFAKIVDPLQQRIVTMSAESATLAELRDTLLPKLLSGSIRIADGERFLSSEVRS